MSIQSQQKNMERLIELLDHPLVYLYGERESDPNGEKKTFLHLGKVFLRALAKDLSLHDAKVTSRPKGVGSSGSCTLMGMWESGGVYIALSQLPHRGEKAVCYRTIRHMRDYSGGYNHYIPLSELRAMSYPELCLRLESLRKDAWCYERAA